MKVWRLLIPLLLFSACHQDRANRANKAQLKNPTEIKREVASARQALADLKPPLDALNAKMVALHRQFDPLSPGLIGFGDVRAKFYATAEGLGRMSAKESWLAGRIDAAANTGDRAELADISKNIAHTYDEMRTVDRLMSESQQEVQPFTKMKDELQALGKSSCE